MAAILSFNYQTSPTSSNRKTELKYKGIILWRLLQIIPSILLFSSSVSLWCQRGIFPLLVFEVWTHSLSSSLRPGILSARQTNLNLLRQRMLFCLLVWQKGGSSDIDFGQNVLVSSQKCQAKNLNFQFRMLIKLTQKIVSHWNIQGIPDNLKIDPCSHGTGAESYAGFTVWHYKLVTIVFG